MSANTKITKENHWVMVENDIAIIGITEEAKKQLGDIAIITFPALGKRLKKGEEGLVIETVKTATEISSPLDGEVIEVNKALSKELKNFQKLSIPHDWLFKIKITNLDQIKDL